MLKELEYPFDSELILKKSKKMKKLLLSGGSGRIKKNIAVLGGSTTHDIVRILELFLLNHGIEPVFYESEFGQYWEDAVFGNEALTAFSPDIIYFHTSNRNITFWPEMGCSARDAGKLLDRLNISKKRGKRPRSVGNARSYRTIWSTPFTGCLETRTASWKREEPLLSTG